MHRLYFSIIAVLFTAIVAGGQARFTGRVVEVIDGRTMVVETSAGKINAQLQYIETPEPEQQLHDVVKKHLANMAVGKMVDFRPLRIGTGLTVGQATIGGVDVGMQLIRDGAAWHEPRELSGQSNAEASEYAQNEALAKNESRGVWSILNLKTPWQIRAERKAVVDRQELAQRSSKPAKVGVSQFQTSNRGGSAAVDRSWTGSSRPEVDIWGEVFAGVGKETRSLQTFTDPNRNFDAVYTPAAFVEMDGGKIDRRVEFRLLTVYLRDPAGNRVPVYLLGFHSVATDYYFSNRKSRLTVVADKRPLVFGSPFYGQRADSVIGTTELFFYRLTKQQVKTIGKAKKIEFRIDGMVGPVSADATEFLKEIADLVG